MRNILNANISTSFELYENEKFFLAKICQPKILTYDIELDFEIDYNNSFIKIINH